jgi:hypothetical protein
MYRSHVTLPVHSDAQRLRERLATEERALVEDLAALEARVRRFVDVDRPAYESWRRLEFGPLLAIVQELSEEFRMRTMLADRLSMLVEEHGLHPREALHRLANPAPHPAGESLDADEVEARRRAKLARKRAERKEARRAKRAADRSAEQGCDGAGSSATARPARVVDLYRALARRIHPDSPSALRNLEPGRLGALWADVQGAYEAGSLERLLAISAWVETLADADACGVALGARAAAPGATGRSFSERFERLRALQRSRRALERQLSELRADPAWNFAEQRASTRRKLARQARAAIDDEIVLLRHALQELDEFFAAIGPPRAPRRTRRR